MTPELATDILGKAVITIIEMCLVLIVPGLILGLVIAVIQGATSIQEQTLTFLPRMVLTLIMVSVMGSWMIAELLAWFANLQELLIQGFS